MKEYIVKLAVWLVVVVGIGVVMELFDMLQCFLEFACLFFSSRERWRKHLSNSCSLMSQKSSTHLSFLVI